MFILASKSPRRAELLKKIYNKEFIIDPTDADESKIKNIDPSDTSLAIALLKMNEAIKTSKWYYSHSRYNCYPKRNHIWKT